MCPFSLVLCCLIAAASAAPTIMLEDKQTVDVVTKYGPVQGVVEQGVNRFLGIPFAAPPVKELRWKAPQPPAPWNTTLDTTSVAKVQMHMCPQIRNIGPIVIGSEDCLYLNVYAPSNTSSSEPLPVMFWIYGGGFSFGDGEEFHLYDGTHLASQQNVVVVTANYRLGPFGFLASDALRAEDPHNSTGNYGTLDQRAAMRWVQENIRSFGGNPDQVTIFGESAGAFSVCWHMVSAGSAGLFKNAIMESGTCESTAFFQPYANATRFGAMWMEAAGCDESKLSGEEFLSCIRNLKTKEVLSDHLKGIPPGDLPLLYPLMSWGPAIDGSSNTLVDLPIDLIAAGKFNKVPLLIGTNRDEGTLFIPRLPKEKNLIEFLQKFLNETMVQDVLNVYPAKDFKSTKSRGVSLVTDFFFLCSTRNIARAMSAQGVPVFLYQFNFNFGGPEYALLHVFHASELNFVWGNSFPPVVGKWDERHKNMSAIFQQYWGNMARSGDPNGETSATTAIWPQYDAQTDINIVLDLPVQTNSHLQQHECDFWERYQWPRG